MKCYLAGPIEFDKNLGKTWRQEATPLLKSIGIIPIDPTMDEDEDLHKSMGSMGAEDRHNTMRFIVDRDVEFVKESDMVILRYTGVETVGSYHELGLAYELGKKIIIYSSKPYLELPAWLVGVVPIEDVALTLPELTYLLKTYNS